MQDFLQTQWGAAHTPLEHAQSDGVEDRAQQTLQESHSTKHQFSVGPLPRSGQTSASTTHSVKKDKRKKHTPALTPRFQTTLKAFSMLLHAGAFVTALLLRPINFTPSSGLDRYVRRCHILESNAHNRLQRPFPVRISSNNFSGLTSIKIECIHLSNWRNFDFAIKNETRTHRRRPYNTYALRGSSGTGMISWRFHLFEHSSWQNSVFTAMDTYTTLITVTRHATEQTKGKQSKQSAEHTTLTQRPPFPSVGFGIGHEPPLEEQTFPTNFTAWPVSPVWMQGAKYFISSKQSTRSREQPVYSVMYMMCASNPHHTVTSAVLCLYP